jgi:hypothetical protein
VVTAKHILKNSSNICTFLVTQELDKGGRGEVDKSELIKFDFLMDPAIPTSMYSMQFVILKVSSQRCGSSG